MTEKLQKFSFTASRYERPDKQWTCGGLKNGKPCQIGPDERGQCRATFECHPKRSGDRWMCTRSAMGGGRCATGPDMNGQCCLRIEKCQPIRSWRGKRGILTKWWFSLTIAALVIMLTTVDKLSLVSPGPLSSHHGAIESCSDCHNSVDGSIRMWLNAFNRSDLHSKNDQNCQVCHDLGASPLAAHSLSSNDWSVDFSNDLDKQSTTANISRDPNVGSTGISVGLASLLLPDKVTDGEGLHCYSCHNEHDGIQSSIIDISERQCQLCHQKQFQRFDLDHPAFTNYPSQRRTRIIFDHVSHIEKHFKEDEYESKILGCNRCHVPDAQNETMLVNGFESSCQSCHEEQITGQNRATDKGIPILTVPDIDVDTLRSKGMLVGEWPDFTDAELSPLMALYLNADPAFDAVNAIVSRLDLTDLRNASEEELSHVVEFVWMVKQFYFNLQLTGTQYLSGLMGKITIDEKNTDRPIDLVGLMAAMPPGIIESANARWFPTLLTEVPMYLAGDMLSIISLEQKGGVVSVDIDTSAGAQEHDHHDDILSEDGDVLSEDDDILSEDGDILSEDDDILFEDGDILSEDDDILSEDGDILSEDDDILFEDGDILSEDDDILSEDGDVLSEDDDILFGDDDISSGDEEIVLDDNEDPNHEELVHGHSHQEHERLPMEDLASAGGWYRDSYQIYYRPTDHGDRFMKGWLDFGVWNSSRSSDVFKKLSTQKGPSMCVKCHSIDSTEDGLEINWEAKKPVQSRKGFVRFSHMAHVSLVGDEGCVTCHAIDKKTDYLSSFENLNPLSFQGNFQDIDNVTCANCHTEGKTRQNCLTCHNYHVGDFVPDYSEISHP